MKPRFLGIVLLVLACSSANASLVSRAGGQAYYDTATNLTWVADANLAKTSGYDLDGAMTWTAAQAWISSLNAQNGGQGYLGVNDWRLPNTGPLNGSTYSYTFGYDGSTDSSFNIGVTGTIYAGSTASEMAYMYYINLGNTAYYNTSGGGAACATSPPYQCLANTAPFSNVQNFVYWSATQSTRFSSYAWNFNFYNGNQSDYAKTTSYHAWAVRPGDITPVPVSGAVWLFGSALGLMGVMRRKISS